MREYVKDGTVEQFVLWNPVDLGYLTIQVAHRLHAGNLKNGAQAMGRLTNVEVRTGEVILGPPMIFNRDNIDDHRF
jgi:rhamnose transport system substrate-binding protein